MVVVLNIVVIGLVLLIAYWWANQGVFSALLHLVSVVIAGAIALGLWETITVGYLLRGNRFDGYAWGISLIVVFGVSLFVIRLIFDKLSPGNVDLPRWANLVFGAPIGAAAGVITVGILVTGCGFVQSTSKIMNYRGYARAQSGRVQMVGSGLWAPVHTWMEDFYGLLSINALSTATPMRTYYPELSQQAASAFRDSYKGGKGAVAMPEDGASVRQWNHIPGEPKAAVTLEFTSLARDFGEQLTVSASQIRLIEDARGKRKPRVAHPTEWFQDGAGPFRYDDITHYMTSVAARDSAVGTFAFPIPADFKPRFVQVKGVRYALPESKRSEEEISGLLAAPGDGGATPFGGRDITPVVEVTNDIRPIRTDLNRMPGTIRQVNGLLTEGEATFVRGGSGRVPRELAVVGIYETAGSRIVQVDVSRNSPANLFDDVRQRVSDSDRIVLVDTEGFRYACMGYLYEAERLEITLAPQRFRDTLPEIPTPPSSGDQRLRLIFQVTENARLAALMVGDVTVGQCNIIVPPND